jgi:hypothetical protein
MLMKSISNVGHVPSRPPFQMKAQRKFLVIDKARFNHGVYCVGPAKNSEIKFAD